MSIDIIVQRGAGTNQGDDIVEPLLGDIPTALERGRAELDATAVPKIIPSWQTVFRLGVRPGQLGRFDDRFQGPTWSGKITEVRHSIKFNKPLTTLTVERNKDAPAS